MSKDEFTKLFKYMESFRSDVSTQFEEVHSEIAEVKGAVAELAGQIRDYLHKEMIMLARKVDRMERWIHEIAKQTGVKLSAA